MGQVLHGSATEPVLWRANSDPGDKGGPSSDTGRGQSNVVARFQTDACRFKPATAHEPNCVALATPSCLRESSSYFSMKQSGQSPTRSSIDASQSLATASPARYTSRKARVICSTASLWAGSGICAGMAMPPR